MTTVTYLARQDDVQRVLAKEPSEVDRSLFDEIK